MPKFRAREGHRVGVYMAEQHDYGRSTPDETTLPGEGRGTIVAERTQIILIWWALAFAAIFGLAWALLIKLMPLPSPLLPDADVAAFYAANSMSIRIGAAICSWTSGFMVPLATVIAVQMARVEKGVPILAILQFAGGIMMSIFLVLPPLFWGVAAFAPDRAPQITSLMHQLANLTLVTTDQYFVFQWIAIAWLCLAHKQDELSPFPRWCGYFNIWIALLFEVGVAGFLMKHGPFAWNGVFVFWVPLGAFGVWISVMSVLLLGALGRQRAVAAR